jgi:hypothetical protein
VKKTYISFTVPLYRWIP